MKMAHKKRQRRSGDVQDLRTTDGAQMRSNWV